MISKLTGVVWKKLPRKVRRSIIRFTQPQFSVSAAAIVTDADGRVLLLDHYIRPKNGWGLPGGFVEHDEQPEAAIRRELREETGLDLERVRMLRVRTVGRHIEILFRAAAEGKAEVKSREIRDLAWYRCEDLPEKMNKSQKAFIESVLGDEFEKREPAD